MDQSLIFLAKDCSSKMLFFTDFHQKQFFLSHLVTFDKTLFLKKIKIHLTSISCLLGLSDDPNSS
jgi:hypothetical protein